MRTNVLRALSIVHPLCFAAFPLLSLFQQNESDVVLGVLWPPLVVVSVLALVLYGIFLLVTREATSAGVLASLAIVAVFFFGAFVENVGVLGVSEGVLFLIWVLLIAVVGVAVWRARRPLANLTVIVTVGAVALVLPAVLRVASYQRGHPAISLTDSRLWPSGLSAPRLAPGAPRPNIYVLVPDDYARPDILRRYFRYPDTAFLRGLRRRGFVLSPQVRSPYSDSESNTAAELNMAYLDGLPKILGRSSEDGRPVKRLIEDNRAARLLGALGYHYVHLDTDEVTFAGSNPRISALAPPDSLANLWLRKSALRLIGGPIGFNQAATNARFRDSIRSQFDALGRAASKPGPKFVVFHTLLPHDPYVYDAGGHEITFPSKREADLGSRLGMRYYRAQLEHLNGMLLGAIDRILRQERRPSVIVLQSDEGFQAEPPALSDATTNDVRVKGLLALRMPGKQGSAVPQPPNTVNTLRWVMNRTFGTRYPLLPTHSYPEGDLPYQFEPMKVRP